MENGKWVTINGAHVFIKDKEINDFMNNKIRNEYNNKIKSNEKKERENIVKKINDLENTELAGGRYSFKLNIKDASDEVLKRVYDSLNNDYIKPYEGKYATNITKKTYNKLCEINKNISDYLGW